MLGLSKEVSKVHFGPGASKLQDSKVGGQKNLKHFGSEATFYIVVHGRILAKIIKVKVDAVWAPTVLLPLNQNKLMTPLWKALKHF